MIVTEIMPVLFGLNHADIRHLHLVIRISKFLLLLCTPNKWDRARLSEINVYKSLQSLTPDTINKKISNLIKVSSYGLAGYSHDFHGYEPVFAVSHGRAPANPISG